MLEKLDVIKHTDNLYDKNGFITNVACGEIVINKINDLCDAVNELQLAKDVMFNRIDMLNNAICDMRNATENTPISKKEKVEPADPYAEQRKWIGKLCKFWDNDDTQQLSYGVLTKIDTESGFGVQYCCNDEYDYDDCQPVKPDDDIIYKGSDK